MILFFRLGESCSHVGGLLYKIEMVVRLGGNNKSCTDDLCKWTCSKVPESTLKYLATNESERNYLEESTRTRSSSMVWFEQQAGRITSSVIHSILHTNTISPAPSLIKSICSCHPSSASSEAMAWGRAHEKEALTDYTLKQSIQVILMLSYRRLDCVFTLNIHISPLPQTGSLAVHVVEMVLSKLNVHSDFGGSQLPPC